MNFGARAAQRVRRRIPRIRGPYRTTSNGTLDPVAIRIELVVEEAGESLAG